MFAPQLVGKQLLEVAGCCQVKLAPKMVLHQKPPYDCFAEVTRSLHGRCWVVCKHWPTASRVVVRLTGCKPETNFTTAQLVVSKKFAE